MGRYVNIENARIIFRNFSGKEGMYNRAGDRSFAVVLSDPELIEALKADSWNVKYLKPREDSEEPTAYIQVSVKYEFAPPKVYVINGGHKTLLDEDSIGELDYMDISTCDMTLSPYHWEVSGKSGIKAYLKTMYVTIEADPFAGKYNDEPILS